MLINRKVDYALRVLSLLASSQELFTTADLSKELDISRMFLAKILNVLARKGVITAKKGKYGGITLKDPKTSLKSVIVMMDPDISFNKCLKKGNACFLGGRCVVHKLLAKAQRDLFAKLSSVSLENIALRRG